MVSQMEQQRQDVMKLVDAIPDERLAQAARLLEELSDKPIPDFDALPYDDEELAPEVVAEIKQSLQQIRDGQYASHEEVLKEFGLL